MKKFLAAMAVLAAVLMATPVLAADAPGYTVTIGGRIRADMGWQVMSKEQNNTSGFNPMTGEWQDGQSVTNFFTAVNTNSYLRSTWTSADKTTGLLIELGLWAFVNRDNDGGGANEAVNLRFGYGWWKVGSCKLLVGQMAGRLGDRYYAQQHLGGSKSGKYNLNGFGFIGGSRNAKVMLQMEVNDWFGFEASIGQPGAEHTVGSVGSGITGGGLFSTNSWVPRFELVLDFVFSGTWGSLMITPGGGISYQRIELNDVLDNAFADKDQNVLSYVLWLPAKYTYGPFTIMINAYYGQNVDTDWTGQNSAGTDVAWNPSNNSSAFSMYGYQPGSLPVVRGTAGGYEICDSKSYGVGIAGQFDFTPQIALAAGAGFTNVQNDAWDVQGGNDSYTRIGAFVSLPYKVNPNFTIQPEIDYYNYGDRVGMVDFDDKAGDEWLLGIHFLFIF